MGSIPGEGTKICMLKRDTWRGVEKEKWHIADSTQVSGRSGLGTQDS